MSFYREKILDHYHNPKNQGIIKGADCHSRQDNLLCGDIVQVYLSLKNNTIHDIKTKTEGCAISVAATSLLSEKIKGMALDKVYAFDSEDIIDMLGISLTPTRLKCAMLGLEAVKQCLKKNQKNLKKR